MLGFISIFGVFFLWEGRGLVSGSLFFYLFILFFLCGGGWGDGIFFTLKLSLFIIIIIILRGQFALTFKKKIFLFCGGSLLIFVQH